MTSGVLRMSYRQAFQANSVTGIVLAGVPDTVRTVGDVRLRSQIFQHSLTSNSDNIHSINRITQLLIYRTVRSHEDIPLWLLRCVARFECRTVATAGRSFQELFIKVCRHIQKPINLLRYTGCGI